MKKRVLISTVVLLAIGGLLHAQDTGLHGVLDVTYQSKYLWRGFDVYNDKSAVQPSLDLDLFGTGLGLRAEGHRANSSGHENTERWDYTLYYQNVICPDEAHATHYMFGYRYFNYPQQSSHTRGGVVNPVVGTDPGTFDIHEVHAVLAWPKILPVEGLVPAYVLVKLAPVNSGTTVGSASATTGTASGFAHIFVLDYGVALPGLSADTPEQVLNLHSEVVFNDGVGPAGQNVDHDWSHAVFGISTGFELAENVVLTPAVYYQVTMDSSVNSDQDETWFTLGMSYSF
jgi:hypothetical protein